MLAALIIVFREVFEAGLIIGIVLAVTRTVSGRNQWIGGGVLLIAAPLMASEPARHWIIATLACVFGFAALPNAWAMRGRHFGWVALSAVVALAVAGY